MGANMGNEPWVSVGDRVVVQTPVGEEDRRWAGRSGVVLRFSKPHGFAVVRVEDTEVFLHPESLRKDVG